MKVFKHYLAAWLLSWGAALLSSTFALCEDDEIVKTISSQRLWVGGGTVNCSDSFCDAFTAPAPQVVENITKALVTDGERAEYECAQSLLDKYIGSQKSLPSRARVRLIKKNEAGQIIEEDVCKFSGFRKRKSRKIYETFPPYNCVEYRNVEVEISGSQDATEINPVYNSKNGEFISDVTIPLKVKLKNRMEFCYPENYVQKKHITVPHGLTNDLAAERGEISASVKDMKFKFELKDSDETLDPELIGDSIEREVLALGYTLSPSTELSSNFESRVVGQISFSVSAIKGGSKLNIQSLSICSDDSLDMCRFKIGQRLHFEGEKKRSDKSFASGPVFRTIEREEEYSGSMTSGYLNGGFRFKWNPTLQVTRRSSDKWSSFLEYDLSKASNPLLSQNYIPLDSIRASWSNEGSIKIDSAISPESPSGNTGYLSISGEQMGSGEVEAVLASRDPYVSRQSFLVKDYNYRQNSDGLIETDGKYQYSRTRLGLVPDFFTGRALKKQDFSCVTCFTPEACPWCGAQNLGEFFYATSFNGGGPVGPLRLFGGGAYPNRGFDPLGFYAPSIFSRPELGFKGSMNALSDSALPEREVTDLFGIAPIDIKSTQYSKFETLVAESPRVRVLPKDLVFINGLPDTDIKPGSTFHESIKKYEKLLSAFEKAGVRVKRERVLTGDKLKKVFKAIPDGAVVIIFIHGHRLGFSVNHNPNESTLKPSNFVTVAELSSISKPKNLSVIYNQSCYGGWHRSLAQEVIGSIGVSFENKLDGTSAVPFGFGGALYHYSVDDLIKRINQEFSLGVCKKQS